MENITIEQQYQLYLQRMGFKNESALHPEQRKQLKDAFFGAWSQFIYLLRDELLEIPEEEAVSILEEMKQEASRHWLHKG